MIFKIHYNPSLIKSGRQNTYVSFCEQKLVASRLAIHCFLYRFLFDRKIINFNSAKFAYEIHNSISGKTIKCFVTNEKTKLFCRLEQLVKPAIINAEEHLRGILFNSIKVKSLSYDEQIAREIARSIDDEIFADLDQINDDFPPFLDEDPVRHFNVVPRQVAVQPVRRSLDYMGIARRGLVVDELPQGALPIYDRDIEVADIQDIDNLPIVEPYENAIGPLGGGDQ